MHRHAVSGCGSVFFIGHGKKGLCADFLVHAAGPENLIIIFFWPKEQYFFSVMGSLTLYTGDLSLCIHIISILI